MEIGREVAISYTISKDVASSGTRRFHLIPSSSANPNVGREQVNSRLSASSQRRRRDTPPAGVAQRASISSSVSSL